VTHPESFGGEFRKNELVRPYVLQPKETEKPEPEPPDVEAINREILGTHLRLRSATGLYGAAFRKAQPTETWGQNTPGPAPQTTQSPGVQMTTPRRPLALPRSGPLGTDPSIKACTCKKAARILNIHSV
jgi:hypothetical protein